MEAKEQIDIQIYDTEYCFRYNAFDEKILFLNDKEFDLDQNQIDNIIFVNTSWTGTPIFKSTIQQLLIK